MKASSNPETKHWLMPDSYDQITAYILITLGITMRLLPHAPNFAPIAALALFGGTYLNRRTAFLIPLGAMLISDFFLGFHSTMPFVYGSFILIICLGLWLRRHHNLFSTLAITLLGSILFFLITNFGAWLVMDIYPRTIKGLMEAYMMGIPFYRGVPADQAFMFLKNTIMGDLFYTGLLFGAYELVQYIIERRLAWQKVSNS